MSLPVYPMPVTYVARSPIWGGYELEKRFGKRSDAPTIGETWELTVRADEMSVICGGECDGMTLGEYIKKSGGRAVGRSFSPDGHFPLLIKFIDAADRLSVQVHPDDEYAAKVEGGVGKTEMWYVVDALPGAELIMGLAEGITSRELCGIAASGGDIEKCLKHVPVCAGDCFFIPSGMIHAIGKGILIAEIQQNCDLTYRLWDYGRPRQLHTAKACDVARPFAPSDIEAMRFERTGGKAERDLLAACRYFTVSLATGGDAFCADDTSFHSVLCFEGEGSLAWSGGEVPLRAGDSLFIPAGMGGYRISGSIRALISRM